MKPSRWPAWLALLALLAPPAATPAPPSYPPVLPGRPLAFPRDFGAHPAFRSEWWYVTGWLDGPDGKPLGFQLTFFRARPVLDETNPSRFAPKQLLFAHVALSDPAVGHLQYEQRGARTGFGLADAAEGDTDVHLDRWSLRRGRGGVYRAQLATAAFSLDLALTPSEPVLPQGEYGYSRKGPRPEQASYYYSQPQLAVSGTVTRQARPVLVTGRAWLDHEWSSAPLAEQTVGWDWAGLNLDDGGALMALRIRDKAGHTFWAGGTRRHADGRIETLTADTLSFTPLRRWRSPYTGAGYPVAMTLRAGSEQFTLTPLFDDQELDSRPSTGAVYWEGAVRVGLAGHPVGRGYLELTGYANRLAY